MQKIFKVTLNDIMETVKEYVNKYQFNDEKEKEKFLLFFKHRLWFYLQKFHLNGFYKAREDVEFLIKHTEDEFMKKFYDISIWVLEKLEEKYVKSLFDKFFDI